MFPYLDLGGFRVRTIMPTDFVDEIESFSKGWLAQNIGTWSEWIDSRLRERYGRKAGQLFGLTAPALLATGMSPPAVSLIGTPLVGSQQIVLQLLTGGPLAVSTFQWSQDKGVTFTGPLTTAPSVALAGSGLSAVFQAASYSADNVYAASTPVPGAVIRWLVDLVSFDAMCRRYRNSQDPAIADFALRSTTAKAEVTEAANSDVGLFDLPTNEDAGSAVRTGGPLAYSEASPYVAADVQEAQGRLEDMAGHGTFSGEQTPFFAWRR